MLYSILITLKLYDLRVEKYQKLMNVNKQETAGFSRHIIPLGSKYSLQHPFLDHLDLCSSLISARQSFTHARTLGKVIDFYTSILTFWHLNTRRED
jgi:hypothetical protein